MKFTLYTADCTGNAKNTNYPHQKVITSEADLKKAVAFDHVCALYDNFSRSDTNFQLSDVVPMDCDNDHSDDTDEDHARKAVGDANRCGICGHIQSSSYAGERRGIRPPSFPCIFPDNAMQGCNISQSNQSPYLQGTSLL